MINKSKKLMSTLAIGVSDLAISVSEVIAAYILFTSNNVLLYIPATILALHGFVVALVKFIK